MDVNLCITIGCEISQSMDHMICRLWCDNDSATHMIYDQIRFIHHRCWTVMWDLWIISSPLYTTNHGMWYCDHERRHHVIQCAVVIHAIKMVAVPLMLQSASLWVMGLTWIMQFTCRAIAKSAHLYGRYNMPGIPRSTSLHLCDHSVQEMIHKTVNHGIRML